MSWWFKTDTALQQPASWSNKNPLILITSIIIHEAQFKSTDHLNAVKQVSPGGIPNAKSVVHGNADESLDVVVVGDARDGALVAHQFVEAGTRANLPQPQGAVGRTAHHKATHLKIIGYIQFKTYSINIH